jgi:hypothetical protein
MARTEQCPNCLGTGELVIPDIREKLENHLIFLGAQGVDATKVTIGLTGLEVAELADVLGIGAPEVSGDAGQV